MSGAGLSLEIATSRIYVSMPVSPPVLSVMMHEGIVKKEAPRGRNLTLRGYPLNRLQDMCDVVHKRLCPPKVHIDRSGTGFQFRRHVGGWYVV